MSTKRYRLTAEAKSSLYAQDGNFQFRISYEKIKGARKILFGQKNCPVITIDPDDIVSTENETAQDRIAKFKIPNRTYRNGQNHNPEWSEVFFEDVTESTTEQDVDVDFDVKYFS